jgi:hypothetical protein
MNTLKKAFAAVGVAVLTATFSAAFAAGGPVALDNIPSAKLSDKAAMQDLHFLLLGLPRSFGNALQPSRRYRIH